METIGLTVEMPPRDKNGQQVRLWKVPSDNRPEPAEDIDAEF